MSEILDAYGRLARYYRALAEARGHFEQQARVLEELLRRNGIDYGRRILDAACGTGDVVARLRKQGYTAIEGTDGCPEMLARARELSDYGLLKLRLCRWDKTHEVMENHGSFDCIFLLGNSIAHFEKGRLKDLLSEFKDHLSPGGVLAFDVRNWVRAPSGGLAEDGRPVRVHRWLGEIQLEGRRFWMDDFCEYGDERQYVHYRFRRISRNGNGTDFEDSPPITVSYAMFDLREASAWLKDAGFDEESIELQLPLGWSYVIVSARRSR